MKNKLNDMCDNFGRGLLPVIYGIGAIYSYYFYVIITIFERDAPQYAYLVHSSCRNDKD